MSDGLLQTSMRLSLARDYGRYKSRDQALKAASKIGTNSNHQLNFLNDQECDFKSAIGQFMYRRYAMAGRSPWGFWIVVAADTESETQAKDQLKELKKFTPGAYIKDGFEIQMIKYRFGICAASMVLISSPVCLLAAPINTYDNSFTVRVPDDWKATPKESFQHPGGLVLEINPPDVKSGDFGLRIYDKGESKMEGKKSPSLVLGPADHDTLKKDVAGEQTLRRRAGDDRNSNGLHI